MSRQSSVVSWSDSPRDQAAPKNVDAVMVDCGEKELCRKSVETHTECWRRAKRVSSVVSYGVKWKQFCGALSSDSGLCAGTTSEHADISGLYARSSALVQGIPRADWAVTHGFGGVEPVPRAHLHHYASSKPVFVSSGLEVTSEHAVISVFPAESSVLVQGHILRRPCCLTDSMETCLAVACGKDTSLVHLARSQLDDVTPGV